MVKISICIATWKRADKLKDILVLLENQSLPSDDYEIIVVDSLSPDHTRVVVEELQAKYSNIVFIPDAANVLAVKRNRGVERAIGEVVVFLDDDVYPAFEFVEMHLKANMSASKRIFPLRMLS